jgi:N-acetylneuraminic acid mutarotase
MVQMVDERETYVVAAEDALPARSVVNWSKPQSNPEGERMVARGGHTTVIADNRLIVFGGHYYCGAQKFAYLNDTWVLDIATLKWQSVKCGGSAPDPRFGHCCCLIGSRMFVIGGKGPDGQLYRDVSFLDVVEWTWSPVNATSTGPTPRFGHACTLVGKF